MSLSFPIIGLQQSADIPLIVCGEGSALALVTSGLFQSYLNALVSRSFSSFEGNCLPRCVISDTNTLFP